MTPSLAFGTEVALQAVLKVPLTGKNAKMNAQTLAEIGSWVARHSTTLIFGWETQPPLAAKTYWTASKCRLQRWSSALKMFERDLLENDPQHDPWPAIEIVVHEILVSELLTRLFSATMISHDFYQKCDELHGLAHGVFVGHVEAKNRALRIMLGGQAANEAAFDRMNTLRRRIERWTDLFLAQLPPCQAADQFGFVTNRILDYRRENRQSTTEEVSQRQQLYTASFAADLSSLTVRFPANPELNRQIAAGVISCFPTDRFDSFGLPKSARMIWIEKAQLDTQMLIDDLIDCEPREIC